MRSRSPNIKVDIGLSDEATPLPLTKSLSLGNDFYFFSAHYDKRWLMQRYIQLSRVILVGKLNWLSVAVVGLERKAFEAWR